MSLLKPEPGSTKAEQPELSIITLASGLISSETPIAGLIESLISLYDAASKSLLDDHME